MSETITASLTVSGETITAELNTAARGPAGPSGASTWDEITGTATSIPFEPTTAPAHSEGLAFYDSTDKSLTYYTDEPDVSMNIGREMWVRVRNNSGATIANGKVVYLSGATGQLPTIALARADSATTSRVIGIATHDIENNSFGYVTTMGEVKGLDTSAFADGDTLYLSAATAGALTTTAPTAPNRVIQVATVEHAHPSQGKLFVHPETDSIPSTGIVDSSTVGRAVLVAADEKTAREAIDAVGIDLGDSDVINNQPQVFKKWAAGNEPVRIARMGDSLMTLGKVTMPPKAATLGNFGRGTSAGTTVDSFTYWPFRYSKSIGIGTTAEFLCGQASAIPLQGNRFTLYYIKESGGGTFDLEYQTNNTGSWTRFTVGTNGIDGTVSAANASTIGAVFTATLPTSGNPSFKVRITNVTTLAVRVIGAGIYYNAGSGIINYHDMLMEGGVDFPNPNTCPSAITSPIFTDMALDCVISCWADASTEWADGGGFDLFYDKFIAAKSTTDFIQLSNHPLTSTTSADELAQIEAQKAWAIRNNQTFVNCWSIFKGSATWMAANGLKATADDPHLTDSGGMVRSAHVWNRLPMGHWMMGSMGNLATAGNQYPLATVQGGQAQDVAAVWFPRQVIISGTSGGLVTLDRTDIYTQTKAGFFFTTGSETFLGTNNNTCAVIGISSFSGIHPNSDNQMLGGRGDLRWRGCFGGVSKGYRAVTGNTTFATDDYTIHVTANSPTITLPAATAVSTSTSSANNAAAGIEGKIFVIRNTGAGTVTIATTSSQLIDGSAPGTVTAGGKITVQSTGTGWITI